MATEDSLIVEEGCRIKCPSYKSRASQLEYYANAHGHPKVFQSYLWEQQYVKTAQQLSENYQSLSLPARQTLTISADGSQIDPWDLMYSIQKMEWKKCKGYPTPDEDTNVPWIVILKCAEASKIHARREQLSPEETARALATDRIILEAAYTSFTERNNTMRGMPKPTQPLRARSTNADDVNEMLWWLMVEHLYDDRAEEA